MRVNKLRLCGPTVFDKPVELDFARVPDGLIAIAGPNGSGKTTLLDSIVGALYRTFPTRPGNLVDAFHPTKDGYIELHFEYKGDTYRSRVLVDSIARKSEAYLDCLNGDGASWDPLTSGKLPDFDETIRMVGLPPLDLVLASVFSPQNRRGNFLELSVADRKRLFVRLLGLDQLQGLSEFAKSVADELRTEGGRLVGIFHGLAGARECVDRYVEELAALAVQIEQIDIGLTRARECVRDSETLVTRLGARAKLEAVEFAHSQRMDGIANRYANRQRAAREETAREVVRRNETMDSLAEERDASLRLARGRKAVEEAAKALAQLREDRPKLLASAKSRTELLDRTRENERRWRKLIGDKGELEREQKTHKKIAGTLEAVPCDTDEAPWKSCQFLTMAHDAENQIPGNAERIRSLEAQLADLDFDLADVQLAETAEQDARRLVQSCNEAMEKLEPWAAKADVVQLAQAAADSSDMRRNAIKLALQVYQQDRAKGEEQLQHEREHEEEIENKQHGVEVANLGPMPTEGVTITEAQEGLAEARDDLKTIEEEREAAIRQRGHQEGALAQTRVAVERAGRAKDLHDRLTVHNGHFHVLCRAFGKDGLQALEIDAAGPAVSRNINELLAACYGDRFTIQLRTQKLKRRATKAEVEDGTAWREDFDIAVRDNEHGRDATADDLSGGERVIISEAIALGLSVFNTQRAGMPMRTLIRDETCGALDAENADRYVRMLRLAKRSGNFERVLFVSHQEAVTRQADAVVQVNELRNAPAGAIEYAANPFC